MFVYGASGHGKVVREIAEALGYPIDYFVDDNPDIRIVGTLSVEAEIRGNQTKGILGIGNNQMRKKLANQFSSIDFQLLIHPKANISPSAYLGSGTVVMAGATVNASVKIGTHVIVNTNSSVDHDCILEDFVHISPNVALSGGVRIGEGTHVGVGACVVPGIQIGKWVTVGAGSVIINDVPDGATIVGNPGRVLKHIKL